MAAWVRPATTAGNQRVVPPNDPTATSAVTWPFSVHYRPFGEVEITTNVIENDLRFPGQLFDTESSRQSRQRS